MGATEDSWLALLLTSWLSNFCYKRPAYKSLHSLILKTFRMHRNWIRLGLGFFLLVVVGVVGLATAQLIRWHHFMESPAPSSTVAYQGDTQLVILGTTHAPHANLNPDSLYAALEIVKPDVILFEGDSAYLPQLRRSPGLQQALQVAVGGSAPENEGQAMRKYVRWHPATSWQPFEWNRRNAYHRQYGILTKPGEVMQRLRQLRAAQQLAPWQLRILKAYDSLSTSLNTLAQLPLDSLNTTAADSLAAHRQYTQYQLLGKVVAAHPALSEFRAFYQLNEAYWGVRNRAMARNIATWLVRYPQKRLVVLTGFNHRYYLLRELRPRQQALHFALVEYGDLKHAPARQPTHF